MTCVDAIREVFRQAPRVHTAAEVVAKIGARYPEGRWAPGTIRATLIGLSVDHASAHHYPSFRRHAFLFNPGRGRFRPMDGAVEERVAVVEELVGSPHGMLPLAYDLGIDLEALVQRKMLQGERKYSTSAARGSATKHDGS